MSSDRMTSRDSARRSFSIDKTPKLSAAPAFSRAINLGFSTVRRKTVKAAQGSKSFVPLSPDEKENIHRLKEDFIRLSRPLIETLRTLGNSQLVEIWSRFEEVDIDSDDSIWDEVNPVFPQIPFEDVIKNAASKVQTQIDKKKAIRSKRRNFDISTSAIVDIQVEVSKSRFKETLEPYGYQLLSKTKSGSPLDIHKDVCSNSLYISYLRMQDTVEISSRKIEVSETNEYRKKWPNISTLRKKKESKWTPNIETGADSMPSPITHLNFAFRSASQAPPGYFSSSFTPSNASSKMSYMGMEIPVYLCTRRGEGPAIVYLEIYDSKTPNFPKDRNFFISRPLNVLKDGSQRYLAFQLDLGRIFDLFEDFDGEELLFGRFFGNILACLYDSNDDIVSSGFHLLNRFAQESDKFDIPCHVLDLFLIQLAELALTYSVVRTSKFIECLYSSIGNLTKQLYKQISPGTTNKVLYSIIVSCFDHNQKFIWEIISPILENTHGDNFLHINDWEEIKREGIEILDIGMGSGFGSVASMRNIFQSFTEDMIRKCLLRTSHDSLFSTVFFENDLLVGESSIAVHSNFLNNLERYVGGLPSYSIPSSNTFSSEPHVVGILAIFSRVLTEPVFQGKSSNRNSEIDLERIENDEIFVELSEVQHSSSLKEEAAVDKALSGKIGTTKSKPFSLMLNMLVSEHNHEWNAVVSRKLFAVKCLESILKRLESSISWFSHFDETCSGDSTSWQEASIITHCLRLVVLPAFINYFWWSLRYRLSKPQYFHIALDFLKMLWKSKSYQRVLREELGIIWDKLLLGILAGDIDLNGVLSVKTENIRYISSLVKLDIVQLLSSLMSTSQDCIDLFYHNDLSSSCISTKVFEKTLAVLSDCVKQHQWDEFITLKKNEVSEQLPSDIVEEHHSGYYEEGSSSNYGEETARELIKGLNVQDKLAISSLHALTQLMEKFSAHIQLAAYDQVSVITLRDESRRILSCDRLDWAVKHVVQFSQNVSDVGLSPVSSSGRVSTNHLDPSSSDYTKEQLRFSGYLKPNVLDEIALLIYQSLKNLQLDRAKATEFLLSAKYGPNDIRFSESHLEAIRLQVINLIFKQHLHSFKRISFLRSLCFIFSAPWLKLPESFSQRRMIVVDFVRFFKKQLARDVKSRKKIGFQAKNEFFYLGNLSEDQMILVAMALTSPPKGMNDELPGESIQAFVNSIQDMGVQLGYISPEETIIIPRPVIDYLAERLVYNPLDFWKNEISKLEIKRIQGTVKLSPKSASQSLNLLSPIIASDKSLLQGARNFIVLHNEPSISHIINSIVDEKTLFRNFAPREYKEGRSSRLISYAMDQAWFGLLPAFVSVCQKFSLNGWMRNESLDVLFLALDGIVAGISIGIYFDKEIMTQSWINEFAKVRYIHSHFGEPDILTHLPSGKYLENQKWIENVYKLSDRDKIQSSNHLGFVLDSTKTQIEFNFKQEMTKNLQLRFNEEIFFSDGKRTILREGKVLKCTVGSTKFAEEVMFLFNDIILFGSLNSKGIYRFREVFHLSICQIFEYSETTGHLHDYRLADTLKTLPRDRAEYCVFIHVKSSWYLLSLKDQVEYNAWLEALRECAEETQISHVERIQKINREGFLSAECSEKCCSLCLKPFSLFSKRVQCSVCHSAIDSACNSTKNTELPVICDACEFSRSGR